MCMTAQYFVHEGGDSRFLMIIQVGKIWMQMIRQGRKSFGLDNSNQL
jgi:hypothetical protein